MQDVVPTVITTEQLTDALRRMAEAAESGRRCPLRPAPVPRRSTRRRKR